MRDVERLAQYLEGTCNSIPSACERLDLDEGVDWEDELLNLNIEPCQSCGWWMESCMLEEEPSSGKFCCEQCYSEEIDD